MKRVLILYFFFVPTAWAASQEELLVEAAELAGFSHGSALMCNLDSSILLQAYKWAVDINTNTRLDRTKYDRIFRKKVQASMANIPRPNAKNSCAHRKVEVHEGAKRLYEIASLLRQLESPAQQGLRNYPAPSPPTRQKQLDIRGPALQRTLR